MANETDPMIGVGSTEENCHELHTIKAVGRNKTEKRQVANNTNCILDCVKKNPVDINNLRDLIKAGEDVNSCDTGDKRTALHEAALKGEEKVVEILLQAGAHIKYKDKDGNTALHFAIQSSSERASDVFKLLLPPKKILEKLCGPGCVQITPEKGRRYVQTKWEHWVDESTSVNKEGFNVLDLALKNMTVVTNNRIKEERRSIVRYIVRELDLSWLLKLLRNNTGRTFNTPFRELVEKMPETAMEVMNKCITKKRNGITFHYELLDDTYILNNWPPKRDDYPFLWEHRVKDTAGMKTYTDRKKKMKINHPLWLMINERIKDHSDDGIYQQLLDHPLVIALVNRKWNHIGKKFHLMNFLFYMVYLFVYTWCVCTTVPPHIRSQNTNTTMNSANTTYQNTTTYVNETTLENIELKMACDSFKSNRKSAIVDVQYSVICISVIMILKEFYQLIIMYGREYFKQKENYVELAVYISSILFVVNVSDCDKTDYRTNWQWILGTFSILLAWTNVLTYARKTYYLGTYALMLLTISKTFLTRVLPLCAVLLIAFAIAFHCVLQSQAEFENFWHSLLATSAFLVCGFEYGEFQGFVDNSDLAPVGYIIYSLYLVTTIVVLNLVVGEAVENVEQIHTLACNTRFALQINYVLEFEGIMCFISSKLCRFSKLKKWLILKPNETIKIKSLKSRGLQLQQILDLIDKTKTSIGQVGALETMNSIDMTDGMTSIKLKDDIECIKESLSQQCNEMKKTNKRMNDIETKIAELTTIKDEVQSIRLMLMILCKDIDISKKSSEDSN